MCAHQSLHLGCSGDEGGLVACVFGACAPGAFDALPVATFAFSPCPLLGVFCDCTTQITANRSMSPRASAAAPGRRAAEFAMIEMQYGMRL
jgi:hypothetical protein